MKLYNTDNRRIELTGNEYIKICTQHNNEVVDPRYQYDLIEITCSNIDKLSITEDMLDESPEGFYMFSGTFYQLFHKYTDFPYIHDEDVVEVTI